MFFPRLRNQAKWAFVLLIVVFAGGFVFLGVGSGGLDLGQLLRDAFGNKGSSTGSLSKAERAVRERPLNAPARRNLAQILQNKGRTDEAIAAWLAYGKLRPKDVTALRNVGDLELSQASLFSQQAQLASAAQSEAGVGAAFRPTTGKLGQALTQDPIAVSDGLLGKHMLLVAKTGRGKSTLLLGLAHYLMAENKRVSNDVLCGRTSHGQIAVRLFLCFCFFTPFDTAHRSDGPGRLRARSRSRA